jgi:hypothetical protein
VKKRRISLQSCSPGRARAIFTKSASGPGAFPVVIPRDLLFAPKIRLVANTFLPQAVA